MGIDDDRRLSLALLLVARLERLSADSLWSHRASGLRGAVLRYLELIEAEPAGDGIDRAAFDILIENGFVVLQKAAGEIEVRESG